VRLGDLGLRAAERFVYDYDVGDLSRDDVPVDQLLDREDWRTYPVCAGGRRAGPPEERGRSRTTEATSPVWRRGLRVSSSTGRHSNRRWPNWRARRAAGSVRHEVTVQITLDGDDETTAVVETSSHSNAARSRGRRVDALPRQPS
jgi:pRiA4b ORF-3-like protein